MRLGGAVNAINPEKLCHGTNNRGKYITDSAIPIYQIKKA
ncbi:uncharacterized protein RAG0_05586 [Rhynchosporium agropyri]|uniref:Uncharacterized protein n=1 Tax=Rhynchosporium agropyri TaxID=914238 RepID=A0A1E1KDM9_9HELO|nr:uncharacterized protein RAG0_05586 [Rhynchosporium agropyri]